MLGYLKISKMQEQKALFFNFFIDFSSLNEIHYFGRIHPPPGCCLAGGILRYSVKTLKHGHNTLNEALLPSLMLGSG
jgi:hypothetical protein